MYCAEDSGATGKERRELTFPKLMPPEEICRHYILYSVASCFILDLLGVTENAAFAHKPRRMTPAYIFWLDMKRIVESLCVTILPEIVCLWRWDF